MQQVRTNEEVLALAGRILAPREKPLVVVSSNLHRGDYEVDLAELEREVGDLAECVRIETGDLTYLLEAQLPPRTHLFGGAGRAYPSDFGRDPDPARSPLRFPGTRVTENLIGDVLAQAHAAGLFAQVSARNVRASGTVIGFMAAGSRALVDVEGNGHAVVQAELTYPPTPLSWVLHEGQRVSGVLDRDSQRLLVERPAPAVSALRESFPHGCVTLALVGHVTAQRGELRLHPGVPLTVRREAVSPNPLDTVDLLLAPGDVVRVRVLHHAEGGIALTLSDVDDDEALHPSLVLSEGGLPWLQEGRDFPQQAPETSDLPAAAPALAEAPAAPSPPQLHVPPAAPASPARPKPGPGLVRVVADRAAPNTRTPLASADPLFVPAAETRPVAPPPAASGALRDTQLQLAAARTRITELEQRLVDSGADDTALAKLCAQLASSEARLREELILRATLQRDNAELEERRKQSAKALRQARRAAPQADAETLTDRRAKWASAEEWVRHEVYLAWVERVVPTERAEWPLRDFAVGEEFAESLLALDAGRFSKALRATVDVVTELSHNMPQRGTHPLRTGAGGDDPGVVRADGAKCMRAYIEQKSPSARRLHYWVRTDGVIELGRVALHDDVRP